MKNTVEINITYNNNTNEDDKYMHSFINSLENMFRENGSLLEAKRIAESNRPIEELRIIFNDEVVTPTDIRLRFFKSANKIEWKED